MYNANNIRTLKKVVKEMKQGEKLYINSICLTINAIEQLRQYIKENVLLPDKSEAEQFGDFFVIDKEDAYSRLNLTVIGETEVKRIDEEESDEAFTIYI